MGPEEIFHFALIAAIAMTCVVVTVITLRENHRLESENRAYDRTLDNYTKTISRLQRRNDLGPDALLVDEINWVSLEVTNIFGPHGDSVNHRVAIITEGLEADKVLEAIHEGNSKLW